MTNDTLKNSKIELWVKVEPRYNCNIVESGIKHHNPNPTVKVQVCFTLNVEENSISFIILVKNWFFLFNQKDHVKYCN